MIVDRSHRRPRNVFLAWLLVVAAALAAPAWAAAAEFTVNSTGDAAKAAAGAVCETATAGECTLRAAIQAANEPGAGTDVIKFSPTVFKGEAGDTIAPALLPEVITPTTIDGTDCNSGSVVPCLSGAGVEGFALLVVKADESTVEHLNVTVPAGVVGIRAVGTGAAKPGVTILDNTIALTSTTSPSTGIATAGTNAGTGNLIEGNTIQVAFGFNFAISLRSGPNRVLGNELLGTGCCEAGITIDLGAAGNQIGGDTEASENVIENFAGGAIRMEVNSTQNEVRRNRGFNSSNFISGGALAAPTITEAVRSSVGGTAEAGATVRVFRQQSQSEGDIENFLGETKAGVTGAWKVTFAKVPIGTFAAATETLAGSTSSLGGSATIAIAPAEEQEEKEAAEKEQRDKEAAEKASKERQETEAREQREREAREKAGSTGGGSPSPAPAVPSPAVARIAPKVKITAGPKKSSASRTARFRFTATPAAGAKFECKLDKGKWATCRSPKTYKKLKPGKHTFQARATAGALTGPAAKFNFTVKP